MKKRKEEIALLHAFLTKGGYDLEGLNQELYAIPKQVIGNLEDAKELKKIQGQFFKNVYELLIDKEKGPRLYLFLYAIDPERYVHLLDFSAPMTDAEKQSLRKEGGCAGRLRSRRRTGTLRRSRSGGARSVRRLTMERFHAWICAYARCSSARRSASPTAATS